MNDEDDPLDDLKDERDVLAKLAEGGKWLNYDDHKMLKMLIWAVDEIEQLRRNP